MSTPYQNISDTGLETPMQQLDFNFLNMALQKRGSDYQQGLNTVKSMANSVLNAPLSNGENQEVRSQYMDEAKQSLQALSKSDLSLPGNQAQASKVFAPFWEDTDILQDVSKTKQIGAEAQKYDTAQSSADEKIRATADPRALTYIKMPLDDLKDAHRGDGSISKVQINPFIPFKDYTKEANQALKDSGFTITHTAPNGKGYLVKKTNGDESFLSYSAFMSGILDDSYNSQFKVIGAVEKYNNVHNLMDMGFSKEQAQQKVGTDLFNDHVVTAQANIEDHSSKKELTDAAIEKILAEAPKGKDGHQHPTPKQIQDISELKGVSDQFQQAIDKTQKDNYGLLTPGKAEETKSDLINHTENYFAKIQRERAIAGWASGKANMSSVDMSEDKAFSDAQTRALTANQQKETQRNDDMVNALGYANLHFQQWKTLVENGIDPKTTQVKTDNGTVIGSSATLQQKITPNESYTQEQDRNHAHMISGLYHPQYGISSTLTDLPGIATGDVANLNTFMTNNSEGKGTKMTPEMYSSFQNIYKALKTEGINIKVTPTGVQPEDINAALLQHAQKYSEFQYQHGNIAKASEVAQAADIVERSLRAYAQNKTDLDKNLHAIINSPSYKNSPLVVNRHGVLDIVKAEDIAASLPNQMKLQDENGKEVTLSALDIAQAHLAGKLEEDTHGETAGMILNGKYYKFQADDKYSDFYNRSTISKMVSTYGKSGDISKQYQELQNKAIPNLQERKDASAIQGQLIGYGYGKGEHGAELHKEWSQAGNESNVYTDPEMTTPATKEQLQAYRELAGSKGSAEKSLSSPVLSNIGPKGMDVGVVSLSDASDKAIAGDANKTTLAGTTLYINLNPATQGEYTKKALEHTEMPTSLYPEFMRGQSLKASVMDHKTGYDWEIQPDRTDGSKPTYATVSMNRMVMNPETGHMESTPVKETYDLSKYTIDMIMRTIGENRPLHFQQAKTNDAKYKAKSVQTPGPTNDQLKKQLGIK